jgi:hypothetical protein
VVELLETKNEKKLRFRSGSGEFIGAAVVTPLIFLIILFIVNVLQIAMCEQKLIYAAYSCGREAVLSFDASEAQDHAEEKLGAIFTDGEDVSVKIQLQGSEWVKGNMAIIQVEQNFTPVLGIQKGVHARRIIMMIEHSRWHNDENTNY